MLVDATISASGLQVQTLAVQKLSGYRILSQKVVQSYLDWNRLEVAHLWVLFF